MAAAGETQRPSLESQLTDAFYTAVGLGVFAVKASEPYRKRLEADLRSWCDHLAANGRAAAASAAPSSSDAPKR